MEIIPFIIDTEKKTIIFDTDDESKIPEIGEGYTAIIKKG
jgi:hypothetical protein